jgi:outer membrane protein
MRRPAPATTVGKRQSMTRHGTTGARVKTALLIGSVLVAGAGCRLAAQDLTLDECLRLALKRSPALAVARAGTEAAIAEYSAARAPLRSTVSAVLSANQLNQDRLSPGGLSPAPGSSLYTREGFAGLTARQLLYDGGRATSARDVAARRLDEQRLNVTATRDETVLRVTRAFNHALLAAALVRAARDGVTRDRSFEDMAQELFEAGRVTRLDVLKAASTRLEAERSLSAAREDSALAVVRLAQTMGLESGAHPAARGALPTELEASPLREEVIVAALARDPDLHAAALRVEATRTSLQSARAGYAPAVSLAGGYGYRDRDVGGARPEWLLGFTLSWPLVTGGATAAVVSEAQARLAQAEAERRALELDVAAQVDQALADWRVARSDAQAAARLVDADREALAAANALYTAGKVTALDVLTAQTDLTRAEGAGLSAAAAYADARALVGRLTARSLGEKAP